MISGKQKADPVRTHLPLASVDAIILNGIEHGCNSSTKHAHLLALWCLCPVSAMEETDVLLTEALS